MTTLIEQRLQEMQKEAGMTGVGIRVRDWLSNVGGSRARAAEHQAKRYSGVDLSAIKNRSPNQELAANAGALRSATTRARMQAAGGVAALGGLAALAARASRKSGKERFVAALKKNRGAIAAGAGAAAVGGGALAAYRARRNK